MSHVIPIHVLDTFDRLPAEGDIGYPTAYAKARAEHERRHAVAAWTPQEDAMLKNFAHEGEEAVAGRLRRTPSSVQQRASRLGVSLAKREVEPTGSVAAMPEPVAPPVTYPEPTEAVGTPDVSPKGPDVPSDAPEVPRSSTHTSADLTYLLQLDMHSTRRPRVDIDIVLHVRTEVS